MSTPLLEVRDLSVTFPVRKGWLGREVGRVHAVDRVSLDVSPGETLGLVGESGCGKSTTGRAILRLIPGSSGRVTGSVKLEGRDVLALSGPDLRAARRSMQMVFQDPFASLDPRMTVGQSIGEPLVVHEIAKGPALDERVEQLAAAVSLEPAYLNRYPHELSGGQRQRVGIARALALEPKLVIADEPVSALDVSVRAQILNLLARLQRERGIAYLFVSHDLSVVRHQAHAVAVMYLGRVVERAPTEALFRTPRHPYTQALLSAIPEPDPAIARTKKRLVLAGEVPSPLAAPSGCHFHPRCPHAFARCRAEAPVLEERAPGHSVACHLDEAPSLAGPA